MFENIAKFFKKLVKSEQQETVKSKDTAKERLHLVLMQDRANVSTDFLELMKQEIIEVIKKYIDVEEEAIDVRLTNKVQEDGTNGAPFLYANIPIVKIKNEVKEDENKVADKKEKKSEEKIEVEKENQDNEENKENKENKENDKLEKTENKDKPKEKTKNEDKQDEEKELSKQEENKDKEDKKITEKKVAKTSKKKE